MGSPKNGRKPAPSPPAGPLWMWAAVIDPAKGISQLPVIDPAFKSKRSFTDPTAPLETLGTSFRLSRMAVRTFVSHGTAVAVGVGVLVGVSVAVALGVAVGGIGVRVGRGVRWIAALGGGRGDVAQRQDHKHEADSRHRPSGPSGNL